jgi:hypothetical protein
LSRLVIGTGELTVRSAAERWIPSRSAGKDTVGEITVDGRLEIWFPVLRWQRQDILRFEDPGSAFSGVTLTLPARKRVVEELRSRGYPVTDRRPNSPAA